MTDTDPPLETRALQSERLQAEGLLPLPEQREPVDGSPLSPGAAFAERYPRLRSPRIEAALARLRQTAGPARADAGAARIPLIIDCAAASPALPALHDDESYVLNVAGTGVTIEAATEWGVLRALATLRQLAGTGAHAQRIVDRPRFPWRGLMLDVARHFLPSADLRRTIDGMALIKLNVLHLHLSDDQAFRLPSAHYPRLTSAEHYRRDEIAALVEYAAERGIRIVPEIDVPGHVTCWLLAYPEWGSGRALPSRRFGVHRECLDPTRPEVLDALTDLFGELGELFPDAYVHMGGDEVNPEWWRADPDIVDFMARHDLADPVALQARFHGELLAMLQRAGKRPVAWDDALHADLPAGVTVQAWRGAHARDRALAAGFDCLLSAPYYLDLYYPADLHYGFDPAASETELLHREDAMLSDARLAHVAAGMAWTRQWREVPALPAADRRGRLLGGEACLWAELVDPGTLDMRLWSRLPAVAERLWSPADRLDARDMGRRLNGLLDALPAATGIDVLGDLRRRCDACGVPAAAWPLIEMLEPVKWYARLLGEEALAARLRGSEMPKARPYDMDTPLDRVIDLLPPQALGVTRLAALLDAEVDGDAAAREALRAVADRWRGLPETVGPAELTPSAEGLRELGALVAGYLDGRLAGEVLQDRLTALAEPRGEYLLAPVPLFAGWLQRRTGP